jgi:hypothetical protein
MTSSKRTKRTKRTVTNRPSDSSVVFDIRTEKEIHYSLPAREAVIAAYAQFCRKDMNTWGYERKYGHLAKSIDRSGKWNLPAGYMLEDFVAYDIRCLEKNRAP